MSLQVFYICIGTWHFCIQKLIKSKNEYYGRDIFCTDNFITVLKYIFLGPGCTFRTKLTCISHLSWGQLCKKESQFYKDTHRLFVQNTRLTKPIKLLVKKQTQPSHQCFKERFSVIFGNYFQRYIGYHIQMLSIFIY